MYVTSHAQHKVEKKINAPARNIPEKNNADIPIRYHHLNPNPELKKKYPRKKEENRRERRRRKKRKKSRSLPETAPSYVMLTKVLYARSLRKQLVNLVSNPEFNPISKVPTMQLLLHTRQHLHRTRVLDFSSLVRRCGRRGGGIIAWSGRFDED